MSPSRSQPCGAPKSAVPVVCDLCEAPFLLAPALVRSGQVAGLLVCTLCTEDNLDASTFNARSEVGMARSGGVR